MKRHTQEPGIRKWAGDDFLDLGNESLRAIEGFLTSFGQYVVSGCGFTKAGAVYNVAPGLVSITGLNAKGETATMIVPFAGAANVPATLYLTLECETLERAYLTGGMRPIAYDYYAKASTIVPDDKPYFTLTAAAARFSDKVQDANHRFVTDADKTKWNNPKASEITQDANNRFVSDAEKAAWNAKQTAEQVQALINASLGKLVDISGWTGLKDAGTYQVTEDFAADSLYLVVTYIHNTGYITGIGMGDQGQIYALASGSLSYGGDTVIKPAGRIIPSVGTKNFEFVADTITHAAQLSKIYVLR